MHRTLLKGLAKIQISTHCTIYCNSQTDPLIVDETHLLANGDDDICQVYALSLLVKGVCKSLSVVHVQLKLSVDICSSNPFFYIV
jgi:hypothetical protein